MSQTNVSRHQSYNNRFRDSTNDGNQQPSARSDRPFSLSENVDLFGHAPIFGQMALQEFISHQNSESNEQPGSPWQAPASAQGIGAGVMLTQETVGGEKDTSRPLAPGKPRRLSRQTSTDVRREKFASSRAESQEGKYIVTSADSGDDVFVDMQGEQEVHKQSFQESSIFSSKKREIFSTSSTASILPNPYNRVNHRIHSIIWCCSCLYFVFFCCLPAIHYMEQSDLEFSRNNQKRAQLLGRTSSCLYFVGALITLAMFTLIFFLAIFFTI